MSEPVEKKVTYSIDELFKDASTIADNKGIQCMLWGASGVGKTYAALTFPDPIYVIDTDGGVTSNLRYFKDKKIKLFECFEAVTDAPVNAKGEEMDEPFDVDPLISLEKFDMVTKSLIKGDITSGTVVIDTITDIWSWIGTWLNHKSQKLTAKSGTEYMSRFAWGDANNRYDWIMKRLKQLNCNLVLLARSKAIYDDKGNLTAGSKPDAQKRTEYYMDYFIELKKKYSTNAGLTKFERTATITKSRGLDLTDPIMKDFNYTKLNELIQKSH